MVKNVWIEMLYVRLVKEVDKIMLMQMLQNLVNAISQHFVIVEVSVNGIFFQNDLMLDKLHHEHEVMHCMDVVLDKVMYCVPWM